VSAARYNAGRATRLRPDTQHCAAPLHHGRRALECGPGAPTYYRGPESGAAPL